MHVMLWQADNKTWHSVIKCIQKFTVSNGRAAVTVLFNQTESNPSFLHLAGDIKMTLCWVNLQWNIMA